MVWWPIHTPLPCSSACRTPSEALSASRCNAHNHVPRLHRHGSKAFSLLKTVRLCMSANTTIPGKLWKLCLQTMCWGGAMQGIYGDLVPAWYAQVGQSLAIVIVFTVGLPHPAYVLYRSMSLPMWPICMLAPSYPFLPLCSLFASACRLMSIWRYCHICKPL